MDDDAFFRMQDNVLPDQRRQEINQFLHTGGDAPWQFGWKSRGKTDAFSFWHRHFAGYKPSGGEAAAYDCEPELEPFPLIAAFWNDLAAGILKDHRLIRCYANGHTYGSDGTVHTDTSLPRTYTCIYYPHKHWEPNWAGETTFFDRARTDIVASVYPKPNRMVIFDGRIPHAARGVSRLCPALRVTLIFKTDRTDAG